MKKVFSGKTWNLEANKLSNHTLEILNRLHVWKKTHIYALGMLGVDDQDEVSWGTRFKDNGEITDLVKESSVLERFLAEVRALCAQGTVINELTQGSIVAPQVQNL